MATAKKTPAKKAAPATKAAAPAEKTAAKTVKAVAAPAKKATAPVKTAAADAAPATKTAAKKAPAKKVATKRTANSAFMKALTPSPELAAIVGSQPIPRTEVVKQMWVYIKEHNLQDEANKRMVNADDKLKAVFGKPQVSMFEMAGLIGKHLK